MENSGIATISVRPIVIEMLKKLQGYYQLKNVEKKSYGKIVEDLVAAEFYSLGLQLNEKEMEAIA